MKTIKQILNKKSPVVFSVTPNDSVLDALKLMMKENISALLVIEANELLGIFTERDYARKIILKGKSSKDTPIQEVMSAQPHTITSEERIDHCMALMTNNHFRHLPVVEQNKVMGIISIGDLVKSIIEDQQHTIHQLESYINSAY